MFSRLFRSRWTALFWAVGVMWTAYDVVGTAPATTDRRTSAALDATGEPIDPAALAALANAQVN